MDISCHQGGGQNYHLLITNKSFEKCGRVQMFGKDGSKPKLLSQRN